MRSMPRLTAASPGTVISSPTCLSSREHIIGVSVSGTIAEVTTAIVSVSANSRNIRPNVPDMNSNGMKIAIGETVSEITVNPTRGALQRASNGRVAIFHVTDDVLDHHDGVVDEKPVPMVSAISDRLSRLKPEKYMTRSS